MADQEAAKWAAAQAALGLVEEGMVVGLGTGSTAVKFLDLLAERVRREGLRVTCVPTSEPIAARAVGAGLRLTPGFPDFGPVDLTVDGADEVDPRGDLIKGGGGALLREKLVALASRRLVILVDPGKHVPVLGLGFPLPVEIVAFGWSQTARRLEALGAAPVWRRGPQGELFRTDQGNLLADCRFPGVADPRALEALLKGVPGVVESGLFCGLVDEVITGHAEGGATSTRHARRPPPL